MDTSDHAVARTARSPRPLCVGPVVVDPPLVQAPMAGFTNYAYRQIVRGFGGVGLLTTEMVSARGFLEIDARSERLPERLWGVAEEPRPLAVQIWDNDPGALAAVGARLAHELRVSVIDVNFGCPVKRVTEKARSGSYLLRSPERVGAIVRRVVRACEPVPVTAKIRLGLARDSINACEVARAVEEAGGAAVTVHGRTAQDLFRGRADWDRIAEVKPHLRRIPLIGNGDLKMPRSVVDSFRRYAIDGAMIGRAALGKPWLFRQAQAALAGQPVAPDPPLDEQRQLLLDHYRLLVDQLGPRRATILIRKYACQYAQGRRGARAFRAHVGRAATAEQFVAVVDKHFPRDEPDTR
jgi:tRNA-dihydrouridine synthase B